MEVETAFLRFEVRNDNCFAGLSIVTQDFVKIMEYDECCGNFHHNVLAQF